MNQQGKRLLASALSITAALTACGGGDDNAVATTAKPTTTTAAPTTTVQATTTTAPPAATAGDVRACVGVEAAIAAAVKDEKGWLQANSFSGANYDEMLTTLKDGVTKATAEADNADIARALIELEKTIDGHPPFPVDFSDDVAFNKYVNAAGNYMDTLNSALPPVTRACGDAGQIVRLAPFAAFSAS